MPCEVPKIHEHFQEERKHLQLCLLEKVPRDTIYLFSFRSLMSTSIAANHYGERWSYSVLLPAEVLVGSGVQQMQHHYWKLHSESLSITIRS